MFTNMYQLEQDGRMHQQALLDAQRAQDLASAAQAHTDNDDMQHVFSTRWLTQYLRPSFLRSTVLLRSRSVWLSWLVVLVSLVVLVIAPPPASAADHPGNATGGRSTVVSDGRALDGYRPVVDPASDTSMFAVDDAGNGHSITAVNDPGDAAGTNAVVDPGNTNARHGRVAVATSGTYGVETRWLAGMALMVLIAIVLVNARRRRQAAV